MDPTSSRYPPDYPGGTLHLLPYRETISPHEFANNIKTLHHRISISDWNPDVILCVPHGADVGKKFATLFDIPLIIATEVEISTNQHLIKGNVLIISLTGKELSLAKQFLQALRDSGQPLEEIKTLTILYYTSSSEIPDYWVKKIEKKL